MIPVVIFLLFLYVCNVPNLCFASCCVFHKYVKNMDTISRLPNLLHTYTFKSCEKSELTELTTKYDLMTTLRTQINRNTEAILETQLTPAEQRNAIAQLTRTSEFTRAGTLVTHRRSPRRELLIMQHQTAEVLTINALIKLSNWSDPLCVANMFSSLERNQRWQSDSCLRALQIWNLIQQFDFLRFLAAILTTLLL